MRSLLAMILLGLPAWILGQQIADTSYCPDIAVAMYERGMGPVIFIDEGHHNFHTKNGRYTAFARLLERDGYRVLEYKGQFEKKQLSRDDILVISNALNEINVSEWYLPNPSAFSEKEIKVLRKWVRKGGSLFLIADHMPMAGAAADLAAAFGFEFSNGFVLNPDVRGPAFFSLKDGSLNESIITSGGKAGESVQKIATFTGQAFRIPDDATPILTLGGGYINLLPDTAWVFNENTPQTDVEGWSQGAFRKVKKGRIVVFGEAAMFSAQLAGPQQYKVGMNSPVAPENYQLLLNIIHWLDGKQD